MQANKIWKRLFSVKHIKEHYNERISSKTSVGLDKITAKKFETALDENIDIIFRKVNNQTYKFTRYKQLLLLKGPNKPPRAVSIPTVRDKLTLSILNELIVCVYGDSCKARLPQLIINEVSNEITNYDSFIKFDIKSFYSSIDQDKLLTILKSKIRKKTILHLIVDAIQTQSIAYPIKEKTKRSKKIQGIPEGLPISNALANIYLSKLDEKYQVLPQIKYWRYVDDILVFVDKRNMKEIEDMLKNDITKLGLSLNDKEDHGEIANGFEYLGYKLSNAHITIRQSSIFKFEQSIEELLRASNKNNAKYIEWKLNNKITGFVLNNNKYGWLFFYSQINDIKLLFHLDNLVSSLLKRYKLNEYIQCKRFVRTYYAITKALHTTKYIPNFDNYCIDDKREVLTHVYDTKVKSWEDSEIEYRFRLIMAREIRDIEKDIESFS